MTEWTLGRRLSGVACGIVMLWILGVGAGRAVSAQSCAAEPPELPPLSPPSSIVDRARDAEEIRQRRRKVEALAEKKLKRARLLFKTKHWQECIDLCDEILVIDPGNGFARILRRKASESREGEIDANVEVERRLRDAVALRQVTKEGLIPRRGPDVPRPNIDADDMPFPGLVGPEAGIEERLRQELPEINLIDADLNYVLQLLFKTTGVNIVYNPADVSGKAVTIHARNLTLEDVLKYLCRTMELGYTVDKRTVWIYGASNQRAAQSLMRPVVIPLKVGLTAAGGGGENDSTSDIEDMMLWMEQNWPGWPPETKWKLDRKLNRLIVASTPDIIEDVRKMTGMLDVAPVQIMISARFVQVTDRAMEKLGFNYSVTPNPQNFPTKKDDKITLGQGKADLGVAAEGGLNLGVTGVLNEHQFNAAMTALDGMSGAKVLTAPRVIALNNKSANIRLQRAYPYPTDWETVTAGSSGSETSTTATTVIPSNWAEQDLGLRLDVYPSVGADMKTITLQIIPEITDLQEQVSYKIVTTAANGTQQAVDAQRPVFQTNTLEVEAVVEDGETVVVGGLFRDNLTEDKKGVPVLEKVPVLGKLFQSNDRQRERSCLLIFVTARIITPRNRLYNDAPEAQEAIPGIQQPVTERNAPSTDTLNRWLGDPR